MTDRHPSLEPYDVLAGAWVTESTHPIVDGAVPGAATFEWWEGGHYLLGRTRTEHELIPDSIWVFGAPEFGEGLVMEGFDSRGVRRTYGTSFDDGVLRCWRDAPGIDQRFSATPVGDSFEGLWLIAETPGDWKDDLKVIYRRTDRGREADR
jgi:hypothetical protein